MGTHKLYDLDSIKQERWFYITHKESMHFMWKRI